MTSIPGVVQTVREVLAGHLRVEDCCRASLQRAASLHELRAIRTLEPERAWRQVDNVTERLRSGERPALAGVPMLIKDNVAWQGLPRFAGRPCAGEPAAQDAVVLQRLLQAGAVVVGTANMDELAYGVTGSNPHTGQIRNPVRPELHPGGSSGGSAAAVAAGIVAAAVGTDTVGSIRIPASLCGVAGIRPSFGMCPIEGVAPLSPSLDCVGPLARSAADLALVLSVMAGDPSLATPARIASAHVLALQGDYAVPLDASVEALLQAAISAMESIGWEVERGHCAAMQVAPKIAGPIVGYEAARAWGTELQEHPERFGSEVAGHLRKGLSMSDERYARALRERQAVIDELEPLFDRFDLIALPATAGTATSWTEPGPQLPLLALAAAFSLTGHAACCVPMGRIDGAPVGLQIAGRSAQMVLAAAASIERALQAEAR